MIKKLIITAGSMKTGMLLFTAVILMSITGTVLPQIHESSINNSFLRVIIKITGISNIYKSPVFIFLLTALSVNTGLCTIKQFMSLLKIRSKSIKIILKKWGIMLIHLSVILIAAGGIVSYYASYNSRIMIPEGGSYILPDEISAEKYSIKLDDFSTIYYENGSVSDWISKVTVTSSGKIEKHEIKVNHPYKMKNLLILQSSFSYYYEISVQDSSSGNQKSLEIYSNEYLPIDEKNKIGIAFMDPDIRDDDTPPLIPYVIISDGYVIKEGYTIPDLPVIYNHNESSFTVSEISEASGFIIRYNPGLIYIWTGFIILSIGVMTLFLFKPESAGYKIV